jgi:hypothetical protein
MIKHVPTKYVESAGLIDMYKCSCGWQSNPYYDGAEYAYAEWQRHKENADIKQNKENAMSRLYKTYLKAINSD